MKSFNPEYMGTLPWGTNPINPEPNQIWFSQDPEKRLFSWYEDHWVEVMPANEAEKITVTLTREQWKSVSKAIDIALHGWNRRRIRRMEAAAPGINWVAAASKRKWNTAKPGKGIDQPYPRTKQHLCPALNKERCMTKLQDMDVSFAITLDTEKDHQPNCTISEEPSPEIKARSSLCVGNITLEIEEFMVWGERLLKESTHPRTRFWKWLMTN